MTAERDNWWKLWGTWSTTNHVPLATWSQELFSRSWRTVSIHDRASNKLATRAEVRTDAALKWLYDWEPEVRPDDAPLPDAVSVPLLDCVGGLAFVIREETDPPHFMNIYGSDGRRVAKTLMDTVVERVQFVSPENEYLLAIAEAPGVLANISRADMPRDATRGGVLPYTMRFEEGGYENASKLMGVDYRWVMAAAAQVRATREARRDSAPAAAAFVTVGTWVAVAIFAYVFFLVCYLLYRMVYPLPTEHGTKNPFLWTVPKRPDYSSTLSTIQKPSTW